MGRRFTQTEREKWDAESHRQGKRQRVTDRKREMRQRQEEGNGTERNRQEER